MQNELLCAALHSHLHSLVSICMQTCPNSVGYHIAAVCSLFAFPCRARQKAIVELQICLSQQSYNATIQAYSIHHS